jgi:hypothetical protein
MAWIVLKWLRAGSNDSLTVSNEPSLKVKLSRYRHVRAKGERIYSCYSFLTSALDGVSGQRQAPPALHPRNRTLGTHWIGGWMGLRADLDTETAGTILCLCRGSSPGRPVCSQTLH